MFFAIVLSVVVSQVVVVGLVAKVLHQYLVLHLLAAQHQSLVVLVEGMYLVVEVSVWYSFEEVHVHYVPPKEI